MDTINYPVTDRQEFTVNGLHVIHEVSDMKTHFKHRLCAGSSLGEWVSWEWFATADCSGRKFMACQANWQPMFPQVFEVVS